MQGQGVQRLAQTPCQGTPPAGGRAAGPTAPTPPLRTALHAFPRLAHCSAGPPESTDASATHSQLGWHQLHLPQCARANAEGCWCQRADWDNPLGDGLVYRLTGGIPSEWVGDYTDDLEGVADPSMMRTGRVKTAGQDTEVLLRAPANRYSNPKAWTEGPRTSDYNDLYAFETGRFDFLPGTPTSGSVFENYYYDYDRMNDYYDDDYGVRHWARLPFTWSQPGDSLGALQASASAARKPGNQWNETLTSV
jgi:hypothetical protein